VNVEDKEDRRWILIRMKMSDIEKMKNIEDG
jgi:hypothetical protein